MKRHGKVWRTVLSIKGFDIKILDGAESGDCPDYIIDPPLGEGHTYPTISDAVKAITGS
ncbi:hypothetical protein [Paenibacillus woosongensis]|uniref:Uncharacterized protein n=1 Tax=Paenibacillus woosongensis TaxID=307580 RepID=A0ABQ4MRW1_9BACL|nr:hypothetical protein [Paenibacillus woosongensis]GIP58691.1 hypothetical protein J15TS10_25050 [Paenibacillus woosongensis]